MSAPPVFLSETVEEANAGFTLDPPPQGATPGIDAQSALDETWAQDGTEGGGDPTAAHLTFAHLSWADGDKDTPVWVVTYEGTCVPIDAGLGSDGASMPQTCRDVPVHALLDANTGEFIASVVDASLKI